MILDTSAIVAIVMKEPGFEELIIRISADPNPGIGAATLTETAIVLSARLKRDARSYITRFLTEASVGVIPFGETHFGTAVEAWLRFGKGRHPAALNFGDCLSYAVAKLADEPLLFVGEDFAATDIAAG